MEPSDHDLKDEDDLEPFLALLTTSSPESSPASTRHCSSPLPNPIRYESPTSSPLAPLDNDNVPFPAPTIAANEREVEQLSIQFDLTLKSADIQNDTRGLLAEMKAVMVMMGSILFSGTGDLSSDSKHICRVKSAANWLILRLRQALEVVQGEIHAVESILQLVPFTVCPKPEDLWTNYKQMAELIVGRTTIPSASELDLCNQLCHMYDTCVYRQRLANVRIRGNDEGLIQLLDSLYDAIMTLPTAFKKWMMAMKRVGDDFTKPTMQRILHSPGVMKDIVEFEGQRQVAVKTVLEEELVPRPVNTVFNTRNRRKGQQPLPKH